VFRGVQELLTNIEQHAHASHAQVSLDFQDTMLIVSVEDDGSGFDAKAVHIPGQGRQGLGLSTTRERIELLGGNIQIESRIGQGTKVRMTIPNSA
jgi:two-component system sensor histidine kinase DegS